MYQSGLKMKQLVCDFCNSVRLGAKVGYREFKKTFDDARHVHRYADQGHFFKGDVLHDSHAVNKVRDLAQKNYRKENDLHIPE